MAQEQCVFLMFLFAAVLCSVSCVKVLPVDGTSVPLASGFNVQPSPVVPQDFTSVTSADTPKIPILPPQIPTTSESKTEISSPAKLQYAPAVAEIELHTNIEITLTITPTPLDTGVRIQPSKTMVKEMNNVIAPTNVVKTSATTTFDEPAVDLLPPKIIKKS